MFEIDKKQFGAFVSALRREKGYTQKELAEKLCISDKAVSKWETGTSLPDTALLVPLSEILGVSVTELLLCRHTEKDAPLEPQQVEQVIKTALGYSGAAPERAWQRKSKWPVLYGCALLVGIGATGLHFLLRFHSTTLITATLLSAVFGACFCFFVKTKLPEIYDRTRIGLYYDGFFRMNLPGVAFNNSNWPHIVRSGRIWSCLTVSLYPLVCLAMNFLAPALWRQVELGVCLTLVLGGLFVPMYVLGKKYE